MKRKIAIVAALAIAGATSGCGGSGSASGSGSGGGPPAPSAMDAFFTAVKSLISTSDDSAEPVSVEAMAATTPEDIDPEVIY